MIKLLDLDFLAATPSSMADWTAARGAGAGLGEATFVNAAGELVVAASGEWRIDHDPISLGRLGLLREPRRVNHIRNSICGGTVAGSPGTFPTHWVAYNTAFGLSWNVVGGGTEKGWFYVDVRISGTSSNATAPVLRADETYPAAAVGQQWTHSLYIRRLAGSLAGISNVRIYVTEWNAAGVFLGQQFANMDVAAGSIGASRRSLTVTLAQATTGRVGSQIDVLPQAGVAIDCTFRISVPQLEQGAFPTSPILNVLGFPAATTREADDGVTGVSALSAATLYLEERTAAKAASGGLGGALADDGTANNRISAVATGGTGYTPSITGAGINIASFSAAAITDGAVDRLGISYAANFMAAALDGISLGIDSSGVLSGNVGRIAISAGERAVHLRALRLYAGALSLAQLQALTLDGAEPAAVGIGLPAIRRPAEAAERLIGLTQTHESPFDGTVQTLEMPGARWELTATWPTLGPDDRRLMAAFLASLRGRAGRFVFSPAQWSPRRATGGGTPVINGDFQAGATLSTRGWTALGQAMRAGDWLSYVDTRGRRRLHLVLTDASADAVGVAALSISPPIRRAGADGAAVEVTNPSGVFMLPQDEAPQLNIRAPSFGQVTITMREALA